MLLVRRGPLGTGANPPVANCAQQAEKSTLWIDARAGQNFQRDLGALAPYMSGPEEGVIMKGVFSPEESLESLESLTSLESLENGWVLLYFPRSGGSLKPLESLNSLENGFKRPLFFSEPEYEFQANSLGALLSLTMRDTPHVAQYPFEIVSQRGVSHPFALFSCSIAQILLRYPFCEGVIAAPLCMLSKGETLRKEGGDIAPN